MQIYSDHLVAGLRANPFGVRVREIVPRAPQWAAEKPQAMRALRYLVYPLQVRSTRAGINHITEAGYAHLLRSLDPNKTVVTVHDIIPLLSWRGAIPGLSYPHAPRLLEFSLSCLQKAACVVTPSESVKRDLVRYCGCQEDNIHVLYLGIDKGFRPLSPSQRLEQRRRFGLPLNAHLILISGHQAYKNHSTCFLAVQKLRQTLRRDVWIVRVGENLKTASTREDSPVIDLGLVPSDVMPFVYNAVDSLLFPSWYEGFGWPPLEAMACGIPVVASNVGSIPEIVGNAGYLCAPDDVGTLAEGLRQVLENTSSRCHLIGEGHKRSKEFTWERHLGGLYKLYYGLTAGSCS